MGLNVGRRTVNVEHLNAERRTSRYGVKQTPRRGPLAAPLILMGVSPIQGICTEESSEQSFQSLTPGTEPYKLRKLGLKNEERSSGRSTSDWSWRIWQGTRTKTLEISFLLGAVCAFKMAIRHRVPIDQIRYTLTVPLTPERAYEG